MYIPCTLTRPSHSDDDVSQYMHMALLSTAHVMSHNTLWEMLTKPSRFRHFRTYHHAHGPSVHLQSTQMRPECTPVCCNPSHPQVVLSCPQTVWTTMITLGQTPISPHLN